MNGVPTRGWHKHPMYSVPYPHYARHAYLGRMSYLDADYTFYWLDSKQVIVRNGDSWFLQPDATIRASVAAIMNCSEDQVVLEDWNLTSEGALEGDRARFLDCSWSDYAVDAMTVSFVCAKSD